MEGTLHTGKEGEKKLRGRFMGKLFKDKKESTSQDEVDDFLRGPSDKLHMVGAAPSPSFAPPLVRIDTRRAPRWPTATEVQSSRRRRSASPKRSRKGLVVRFSDEQPEVIGEGGDEAQSPVAEIGLRMRAHSHLPVRKGNQDQPAAEIHVPDYGQNFADELTSMDAFRPGPIRRTQTGFESIPDRPNKPESYTEHEPPSMLEPDSLNFVGVSRTVGDRRSFADMVKAEMRSGEGLALVKSHASNIDEQLACAEPAGISNTDVTPHMDEIQINTLKNTQVLNISTENDPRRPYNPNDLQISNNLTESPAVISREPPEERERQQDFLPKSSQSSNHSTEWSTATSNRPSTSSSTQSPAALSRTATFTLQEAAVAVGDDALNDFSRRIAHLFTLFRLSTEAVRPLIRCSIEDLTRAALWWFLKGRLRLEATIRDRPSNPEAQQISLFVRQQAYADLAKSLWLVDTVIPQRPEAQLRVGAPNTPSSLIDVLECRQAVLSSLRKLTMSMKRNNILPPDGCDAPLAQGLDASIWVKDDGNRSLLASQRTTSVTSLSEAFPLGDTNRTFHYGRMFVEAILVEEAASQQYRCPALVSIVRSQKENFMALIITNQDGTLNLSVHSEKSRGTTWNDVRWQAKHQTIEVSLPRGFLLRLRCSEQDFRVIWGTYDHEIRTRAILATRDGEEVVFEVYLRTFQYFDQTAQSGFPKEPQPQCHLRVFERSVIQKAATGPRKMHRGFRIGLNTSPKTKILRGVDQDLLPTLPTQFGFLRGDGGLPAFLLKIDGSKSKHTLVETFDNTEDRSRLHTLLTGIALGNGEDVVAEALIQGFSVLTTEDADADHLEGLEWQNFRVINYDHGDLQSAKTVLSENLRVVLDFKTGTLTDRVNVGPGELKLRLNVNSQNELKVLRQPQQDLTLSISEAQVAKEVPKKLEDLLKAIEKSQSTRTYIFPSTKELHLFQAALTGFQVLYDGTAASFNISRRRMVVPIYKKWDAATTRIQIVQKEKVIQLVAFFEKFSHGDCMNFALKSTDVFEVSSRGGKFSVRIVDAKFALPKSKNEGEITTDHEFVCLDMPEYPGEHDDITILFETEAGKFLQI
jgi:hypothetical protein